MGDIWIGTYAKAGGAGLQRLVAGADGRLSPAEAEPRIRDASYAAWDATRNLLWVVEERAQGRVHGWRRSPEGWQDMGSASSGGDEPCFIAVAPDGRHLAVANYGSGSAALVSIDPTSGRVSECAAVWQDHGRGSDPERQEGPHVHCTRFDGSGDAVWFTDLGLDRVFRWGWSTAATPTWRRKCGRRLRAGARATCCLAVSGCSSCANCRRASSCWTMGRRAC